MKDWLSIGQFSKKVGVSDRALRLYEEIGLLEPAQRGQNGYRYYRVDQIAKARQIHDLKSMGFSLKEIRSLLEMNSGFDSEQLRTRLRQRLESIQGEEKKLEAQRRQVQSLLSSFNMKPLRLNERERKLAMKLFETVTILVTGLEDLETTAQLIQERLSVGGQSSQIVYWDQLSSFTRGQPVIVVLEESRLTEADFSGLKIDVVVVKNMSEPKAALLPAYLRLYSQICPQITVLNADDRASIELAKCAEVQKGKIYYYSKNTGLKDQIRKIGGTVSDGEEITIYGFNSHRGEDLNLKLESIRRHGEEVALLAALTAAMDLGLQRESLPLVV